MSAMTGPRSPTSPWPQESQNIPLAGPSTPSTLFPLCDPHSTPFGNVSSRSSVPELSGPNYFSINVETPASSIRTRDAFSRAQPAIPNPKTHLVHRKKTSNEQMIDIGTGSGNAGEPNRPTIYKLPWNNTLERREPASFRLNTLPVQQEEASWNPTSVDRCAELLELRPSELMLLDVRPYAHFAKGSIKGSLNLCIPTTLLKRPSFDTKKLVNTFTNDADKMNFARWKQCRFIVVYDASTANMKDAGPMASLLKKFTAEGWDGEGLILTGGFSTFASRFPKLIQLQTTNPEMPSKNPSPISLGLPGFAPIAGGCALPESSQSPIPFFGNIRQNMDLVGGVGQIALRHSESIPESKRQLLPPWLREVSNPSDKGRIVAERFLELEKKELERMKQALSYDKTSDPTSHEPSPKKFRVAGIEKGTKNRYNDIYPYDHSRVRLQDVPPGGCDYVNANYVKAEYSDKCYIATQAPVPDTFNDFWRVVWEQDIRLIVSLTAEFERGQVKCHPYWKSGNYGPCRVDEFSQQYIPVNTPGAQQPSFGSDKPPLDQSENPSNPFIIVRHFGLSHSGYPFQQLREVTQLQYPCWPDFGTTSQPQHLLRLIEQCDKVLSATTGSTVGKVKGSLKAQRPVLVHCSAGCGRTGTFCTVDSVLDILKRQRGENSLASQGLHFNQIIGNGNLDLVAKTVGDFRMQRPSMVQNLSQFVLCYESVIEWILSQMMGVDTGS